MRRPRRASDPACASSRVRPRHADLDGRRGADAGGHRLAGAGAQLRHGLRAGPVPDLGRPHRRRRAGRDGFRGAGLQVPPQLLPRQGLARGTGGARAGRSTRRDRSRSRRKATPFPSRGACRSRSMRIGPGVPRRRACPDGWPTTSARWPWRPRRRSIWPGCSGWPSSRRRRLAASSSWSARLDRAAEPVRPGDPAAGHAEVGRLRRRDRAGPGLRARAGGRCSRRRSPRRSRRCGSPRGA